ncbi:hypothetical protein O1611_g4055 [Lasiodiplodia mahajangana]|uniref:Uncharacterized protein n=1 Tax=Lasiodiplodia mahajangana TaxID=1108764 RepID=A0ACC2JQ04_9PEZI|nr:hypothetical protein O1611_g4055 [Lasiodiplodia mahajangana]
MATQLPLDILVMIAEEMTILSNLEAALNFSLVSRRVHDITYPLILKADVLANPITAALSIHSCNCSAWGTKRLFRSSLEFFINSDNPALVAAHLNHTGTDVNAITHSIKLGYCANIMYIAVASGAISVVEFLLKSGAKFTTSGFSGHPLEQAVCRNHISITKLLIEYGALQDLTTRRGWCKDRLILDWIARHSSTTVEMAKTLISHSSDVNLPFGTFEGSTVVHELVSNYHPKDQRSVANFRGKMELLVQAGLNIDAIMSYNYRRQTALNMACEQVWHHPIQVLLELGASAGGAADFHSRPDGSVDAATPLYDLITAGKFKWRRLRRKEAKEGIVKSAKMLLDYGLKGQKSCFVQDQNLRMDVFYTCTEFGTDLSKLWAVLIDGGVLDVHYRNEFGQTLLSQLASRYYGEEEFRSPYWQPNLVRALITAGSDPNTVDDSGMTPLHWAIFYGNFDLVKLLIELGANPLKEVDGATPVHYAFGKPFSRRGVVAQQVMSRLRDSIFGCLTYWTEPERHSERHSEIRTSQLFAQYSEGKWHPLLSSCLDPFIRREMEETAASNEARFFSIMALLFQFGESTNDENGHTPRDIAEKAGILRAGENLELRIGNKATLPQGVAFSEYLACIPEKRLKRVKGWFHNSFPSSPYDPVTHCRRPAFLALVTTLKNGRYYRAPASMACFRPPLDHDLQDATHNGGTTGPIEVHESDWMLLEQGY